LLDSSWVKGEVIVQNGQQQKRRNMKKSVVHAQKQLYMAVRSKDYLLFIHEKNAVYNKKMLFVIKKLA
jgi:hypothetical protein